MAKAIVHNVDGALRPFVIRPSNDDDMRQIIEWLKEEDRREIHGKFLCNWNLTQEYHAEGKLLVLVDELDNIPVAYQWGRLLHPGILQVRHAWRGKGLGGVLVKHCVELALEQDEMVLSIECKPPSSIPFWRSMGFSIVEGELHENARGYRILTKELKIPASGNSVTANVSSFPEERMWKENISATASYSPRAILGNDGKIYLGERTSFSDSVWSGDRDLVIEIRIENERLYLDKAKYEEAAAHGVKRCRNGFYLDVISR